MNEPFKCSPVQEAARAHQAEFRHSAGWLMAQEYPSQEGLDQVTEWTHRAVVLLDESDRGKILVEGKAAGDVLGVPELAVGGGLQQDYGLVFRLRRDLLLVDTLPEQVEGVTTELRSRLSSVAGLITITDMTHGYAELRLIGPDSRELLGRLCGLDFREQAFPNMNVRQSSVAKTAQIIERRDLGDLLTFALLGPRSLGVYLWRTIMDAGRNLGIRPIGKVALGELREELVD